MVRVPTPLLCAGLVVLTVAAFLPLWNNEFNDFDDPPYITQNFWVLEGLTGRVAPEQVRVVWRKKRLCGRRGRRILPRRSKPAVAQRASLRAREVGAMINDRGSMTGANHL